MFRENGLVIENRNVAPGHCVLKISSRKISKNARPGQFVQVLCEEGFDPLLPRPFSFLTASANDFSILYQVVGKGTKLLSSVKKNDKLWVVGPLGNGFSLPVHWTSSVHLLVGGGVGIPPLYHLAQELVERGTAKENIHVFLGARDKSLLLCENEFKKLGVQLHLATDNGSKGKKGFVTEVLEEYLNRTSSGRETLDTRGQTVPSNVSLSDDVRIFTCGPTPMLKAVSIISKKYEVPCEVSVEVPMACGFGACLGCAVKVKDKTGLRFAIACTEGPVFEASTICFE